MSQPFKLVVNAPTTGRSAAREWSWSADDQRVMSIECELKKDKQRISHLTARLSDYGRKIFNELPDPAYAECPVKLYMGPLGNPDAQTKLVFEGKITSLRCGWPEAQSLYIAAHDYSIDLRRKKRIKKFSNLTVVQLAKKVADEYGLELEQDADILGSLVRRVSVVALTPTASDWSIMTAALAAEGIEVYADKGKKLKLRAAASVRYGKDFTPDTPLFRVECGIEHIKGPGKGGDVQTARPNLEDAGTVKAANGAAAKGNASAREGRRPAMGVTSSSGAHSEDAGIKWSAQVDLKRKRKDDLTIHAPPLHDISLRNLVPMSGWGPKMDGLWEPETIHHVLIPGDGMSSTTIKCQRMTGKQAASEANTAHVPFETSQTGV